MERVSIDVFQQRKCQERTGSIARSKKTTPAKVGSRHQKTGSDNSMDDSPYVWPQRSGSQSRGPANGTKIPVSPSMRDIRIQETTIDALATQLDELFARREFVPEDLP